MNRRKVGAEYERYAAHFLEKQGYQIIEYNYCCRLGEIDIVARDGRLSVKWPSIIFWRAICRRKRPADLTQWELRERIPCW